jgi:adenylate cyclase
MPKMNGRDMCRELRMIPAYRHLPIIMLTAKDSGIERAKARKAGVNDFITKPFTTEKLLSVAERLIAEAKIVRERDAMAVYMSDAALKHASELAKGSNVQAMTAYRDEASILFSDVVGFTTLSESMDPESVIELLNGYFDQMVSIIQAHHGTVDKFIGDAIMAILSGRHPEENAYNAVCAAQAMLATLAKIRASKLEERERIHIRIGINSGNVVFGDLGSKASRRDFTVIGDQVNIAQRLESHAKPDHVMISQATRLIMQ